MHAGAAYQIRLDTSVWTGETLKLVIDLTSSNRANYQEAYIGDFTHDGHIGSLEGDGGPIYSNDILEGVFDPAGGFIGDAMFYNSLGIVFDSVGTSIAFTAFIQWSGPLVLDSTLWDQMSCYLLDANDNVIVRTADPFGANALFAITHDGNSTCTGEVFAPMVFAPPETMRLPTLMTDVETEEQLVGFTWFTVYRASGGEVGFRVMIPDKGGRLEVVVYDVTGRMVDKPVDGWVGGGIRSVKWPGSSRGPNAVASGVYLARATLGSKSQTRRIVLIH